MFDQWLMLDSPYWVTGQNASCEARLFHFDKRGREKVLNTHDFIVLP